MRAIDTVPSRSPAPTTTCSDRRAGGPTRQATTAATAHTTSVTAPRHADVVSTKRPVPVSCVTTPPQTSRWRKARRTPSLNPSGVSGGEPKWSTSWRRLPGSSVNWSATGGNHSTTPMPTPHATLRAIARRAAALARRACHAAPADAEHDHADAEAEVRHVGLGAVGGGDDEGHEHDVVAAQHGPRRQQHEHPCEQRQVRVPRLGQRQLPVAAHDEGEQRGDDSDAAPSEPAPPDPQRHGDRRQVDDDRADLHRPRRRRRARGTSARAGRS